MKKRSLNSLSKGVGYSTAVFFVFANHGRSLSNCRNNDLNPLIRISN